LPHPADPLHRKDDIMLAKKQDTPPEDKGEPAAKDPTPVEHGVAQTEANIAAAKGKEKAAADPNPVVKGMPKDAQDDVGAKPSKADLKLSELYDEFERLKALGNKNPDRLAELKKLIAEG